jgi:hypothetical protein
MIWFLTIALPLLAAILAALVPAGRRGSGLIFVGATLPALWLGLVEVPGVTAQWFLLEAHFSLDTPRRIILLLTGILMGHSSVFLPDPI